MNERPLVQFSKSSTLDHICECPLLGHKLRGSRRPSKGFLLLPLCFPCHKISCGRLKPGSKIKGPWIQRTLITFQRVPLGFSHTIPVRGCGSLWFLCRALKLGGINGTWLNHKCQEMCRVAQNPGYLRLSREWGTVIDFPSSTRLELLIKELRGKASFSPTLKGTPFMLTWKWLTC